MKRFAKLYEDLDSTTRSSEKVAILAQYLRTEAPENAAYAVYLLAGNKISRTVNSAELRSWCGEVAGLPDWLVEDSYDAVGDLAETVAHLVSSQESAVEYSLNDTIGFIRGLSGIPVQERKRLVIERWRQLSDLQLFVFNKIITGAFRVGVASGLIVKALAQVSGAPEEDIAFRMMGSWEPSAEFFRSLTAPSNDESFNPSKPYPFYLAYALEREINELGAPHDWLVEWKWDGIRGQLVKRNGEVYIWSRGGELVTPAFPEFSALEPFIPNGTVLDGEIVAFKDGKIQSFFALQKRLGKKQVGGKLLREVPVAMFVYDLLEYGSLDLRDRPLRERREILEKVLEEIRNEAGPEQLPLQLSSPLEFSDWSELSTFRQSSRESSAEGLMLKRLDSSYGVGRKTGDWWKWKIQPYNIDAVLLYAQRGHGRRASLYTDYTFALWRNDELVPVAKAYSGLTDLEITEVDKFIRSNTIDKFGPVRSVKPELVFEIAFEAIQVSNRHKSGVAVRFPRILRWRKDKSSADADKLETLIALASLAPLGG